MSSLRSALDENLFGQHVARAEMLREVAAFSRSASSSVTLLLLVGWPGGGKTHSASLLRNSFPVPDNVHSFSVPLHFGGREGDGGFGFLDELALHVARSCGHSMVLFDDVDAADQRTTEEIAR